MNGARQDKSLALTPLASGPTPGTIESSRILSRRQRITLVWMSNWRLEYLSKVKRYKQAKSAKYSSLLSC